MYRISVPIMDSTCRHYGREAMLAAVQPFAPHRVFLALGNYELQPEKRKEALESLAESARFFQEQGYEVGAWICAFCFLEEHPFPCMHGLNGDPVALNPCPLDEGFLDFAADYIRCIARCGVDLIMFDDDLRYGFLGSTPGCLCDLHRAEINAITGEDLDRETLAERILSGGPNRYRDAWLRVNGDAFRTFARRMRGAVDSVNPAIRMGACACMGSWDLDGVSATELAHLLAGDTQPFLRLIGAPYWAVNRNWGNQLQDVVEMTRMESAWSREAGLEIIAEGDAYPRPRISCPGNYLEGFDTAVRAAGCTDGILKYGVDYHSEPGYETGYARLHRRNLPVYAEIHRLFDGKEACGIRVWETAAKTAGAHFPTADGITNPDNLIFSRAARVLAHNAIPSTYEGTGVTGMAFGENARHLPPEAFEKGLILDIAAARILWEQGVDTGLMAVGGEARPSQEVLGGSRIAMNDAWCLKISLQPGAQVLSTGTWQEKTYPLTYRYENAAGQRFLVLNFCTDICSAWNYIWKHAARGIQIAGQTPWLAGQKLPAWTEGHPALYLQAKTDGNAMAVGLWNFHPDPAFAPEVLLGEHYDEIIFLNTHGTLQGDRVVLDELPPFGFAAFEVRKQEKFE